jgi:phosphate starvation-inducible PhoH-like protein
MSKEKIPTVSSNKPISDKIVVIKALNDGQKGALKTIYDNSISFIYGPAGGGKTHCSVGWALQQYMRGQFKKIVLVRPYITCEESIGYLPGGVSEKTTPFLLPLFDIISEYLSQEDIENLVKQKKIVSFGLGFMRGLTFNSDTIVIADEWQNSTINQTRMLLTRLGSGKLIINGDVSQSDLRGPNGLSDAIERLQNIQGIGFWEIGPEYCVRNPLVRAIEERYQNKR